MKRFLARFLFLVLLCSFTFSLATPLNSRDEMAKVINNLFASGPASGTDIEAECFYLEKSGAFSISIVSDDIMNAAAACTDRKSTKAWTAYKASVYSMYESALDLLQTFGHSDVGLFLMLQAQNNGEWFTYYMLGADAGAECTVWDYITLDEKPVTSDK